MNLLSSLNAGFLAAANGTAEIYVRGTATRATYYLDFEASSSNSSGANVVLDAYGSAEVYVNQLVDVRVKDSSGNLVRSYTDGHSAPEVEVISQAFTGIDYTTGQSGASLPTTLQAVLDLWKTNSGAIDWKVLFGGVATTLQNAIGPLTNFVYNVKSPAYGAVGDGVANDQAAIQAAHAAAVAAGGGIVFFPAAGVYQITSALVWDYRVHIVMVPGATLAMNHATNGWIRFTGANGTNYQTIFYGVAFRALQGNVGTQLSLEANQRLTLIECTFGADGNSSGTAINIAATVAMLTVEKSRFNLNGSAQNALTATSGYVALLLVRECYFQTPATYNTTILLTSTFSTAYNSWIEDNVFDSLTNGTTTGGTYYALALGSAGDQSVTGNKFIGTFNAGIFASALTGSLHATGNEFGSTIVARYDLGGGTNGTASYLELDKYESLSGAGVSYSPSINTEFTQIVSSGTAPTITMPVGFYKGQVRKILYRNTSGGNWAAVAFIGASSVRVTSLPATAVTAGSSMMDAFIWMDMITPGTFQWLKFAEA